MGKEVQIILPDWVAIAMRDVGITEIKGAAHSERILKMHSYTSYQAHDDETAWCAAAVCAWLEESGIKSPKSARALDFLKWGTATNPPSLGCILVLKRTINVAGAPLAGHVGLYVGEESGFYWVLGGNQRDMVTYSRFPKDLLISARVPL